jgi:hypothetical protein
MTPASFQLYIERLNSIRETLTEPNRIKFIDDIFEAIKYKDTEINHINNELSRIIESNMKLRTERDRYKSQRDLCIGIVNKIYTTEVLNQEI